MKVKELAVGNTLIKNNIFLAPMAGYTDYAIRKLQLEQGAGLAFTELVSAKGLMYGGKGSQELLFSGSDISNTAVQIFGSEPFFMRSACESEYLKDFNIVDINMGCPVPKVVKNGEGSALLKDIKKAQEIIKECVKSGKNITIKIRTGQVKGDDVASEFCKMAEDSGAVLVSVHGRVREAFYSGEPDYNAIEKAKNAVKIPVIANGGIFTVKDAQNMIDKTGADGVMIARGAIANPFLVSELTNTFSDKNLKRYITRHVELMREINIDKKVTAEFRKFVPYYFKGMEGVKDLKLKLLTADSTRQILEIINQNL